MFLQYKADIKGVKIAHVEAKYTSQTCSNCGHCARNNRKTQANFICKSCGFKINADLNASRNIRDKELLAYKAKSEAAINPPIVSA